MPSHHYVIPAGFAKTLGASVRPTQRSLDKVSVSDYLLVLGTLYKSTVNQRQGRHLTR